MTGRSWPTKPYRRNRRFGQLGAHSRHSSADVSFPVANARDLGRWITLGIVGDADRCILGGKYGADGAGGESS
jgi:hypothetical protein